MENVARLGKSVTIPVLIQRINERLTRNGESQKQSRFAGSPSFGHFYADTNSIAERPDEIDIESIGRELGVLGADEYLCG
jgi:hypothetical protein